MQGTIRTSSNPKFSHIHRFDFGGISLELPRRDHAHFHISDRLPNAGWKIDGELGDARRGEHGDFNHLNSLSVVFWRQYGVDGDFRWDPMFLEGIDGKPMGSVVAQRGSGKGEACGDGGTFLARIE